MVLLVYRRWLGGAAARGADRRLGLRPGDGERDDDRALRGAGVADQAVLHPLHHRLPRGAAAASPLIGFLHEATGSLTAPMLVLAAFGAVTFCAALVFPNRQEELGPELWARRGAAAGGPGGRRVKTGGEGARGHGACARHPLCCPSHVSATRRSRASPYPLRAPQQGQPVDVAAVVPPVERRLADHLQPLLHRVVRASGRARGVPPMRVLAEVAAGQATCRSNGAGRHARPAPAPAAPRPGRRAPRRCRNAPWRRSVEQDSASRPAPPQVAAVIGDEAMRGSSPKRRRQTSTFSGMDIDDDQPPRHGQQLRRIPPPPGARSMRHRRGRSPSPRAAGRAG